MKTPEQIAAEVHGDWATAAEWESGEMLRLSQDQLRNMMREAIEADRAQRKIVNWDEAGQLVQAYYAAAQGPSADAEYESAMDIVGWVESALEGDAR